MKKGEIKTLLNSDLICLFGSKYATLSYKWNTTNRYKGIENEVKILANELVRRGLLEEKHLKELLIIE